MVVTKSDSISDTFSVNNTNNTIKPYTTDQNQDKSLLFKWPNFNENQFFNQTNMYFKVVYSTLFLLVCMWVIVMFVFANNILSGFEQAVYKEIGPFFENRQIEADSNDCQSNVLDFYDGNLKTFYELIERNEVTLVYLYAHWCGRSVNYRSLIENLSCKYSGKVLFLAVNCFNKNGDCKKYFNFVKFPNIVVHIRNTGFFSYAGPYDFNYLSKYLDLMINPIEILDNFEHFLNFTLFNDGALVAKFNFSSKNDSLLYKMYYQSAMTAISYDFENPIKYGIVLENKLWKQLLGFENSIKQDSKRKIKIMSFSSQGIQSSFRSMANATVENLTNWGFKTVKSTIRWFYPEKMNKLSYLNKFLIFLARDLDSNSFNFKKNYAIAKYFHIKNKVVSTKNRKLSSYFLKYLEATFINETCQKNQINLNPFAYDIHQIANKKRAISNKCYQNQSQIKPICTSSNNENFWSNVALVLIDLNLYSNYLKQLLPERVFEGNESFEKPTALLIDQKNESLFLFKDEFTNQNLDEFVKNQTQNSNKRQIKSSNTINNIKKPNINGSFTYHESAIHEINSSELNSIIKNSVKELADKDLLIFYYNNWCGFCKLVQYNLVLLCNKYFKNVSSFKLLKINVDLNDFSWHLSAKHVPALIFLPAESSVEKRKRESIFFDSNVKFDVKNLLKFVLYNAKNAQTVSQFLSTNLMSPTLANNEETSEEREKQTDKLRSELVKQVKSRLDSLEIEMNRISRKMKSKEQLHKKDDANNVKLVEFSRQIDMYLKNTLDRNLLDRDLLKSFLNSYKRSK